MLMRHRKRSATGKKHYILLSSIHFNSGNSYHKLSLQAKVFVAGQKILRVMIELVKNNFLNTRHGYMEMVREGFIILQEEFSMLLRTGCPPLYPVLLSRALITFGMN